jgi:ubiquinol-cytochrome c reductase cytochrome b subunit
MVHIIGLHTDGSNNPLGVDTNIDKVPFHPYYSIKDVFGYVVFGGIYGYLIYYAPNLLGHPDNYIPANPLVTPAHIQPEFYFLFAYAILRSIPNKLIGVIALFASLMILLIAPYVEQSKIRSKQFRPLSK